MKRITALFLLSLIIFSMAGCQNSNKNKIEFTPIDYESMDNYNFECKLYVNQVEIPTDQLVGISDDGRFAVLPVVKIIEAAGGEVEWKNATTATIEINGSKFVLNTTESTLYCKDKSFPRFNFLEPVAGEE